ncbi:transposase [Actinomyces bowdenii]|uniref:transposase family protein n=1 Tax=Actinomyces bowdenii TaxID=131109 RepID=UPI00214C53E9|nr:transposase family protein [Actinomyces bowdenii]MCR2053846.1 transposase [Actinomyces bowdenii]
MSKGITGLDRAQLSRLVELVVGDEGITGVPRILEPLQSVRVTLMYLRTGICQEAIAEVMGVSQPSISRAIAVVTRIIARVLGPLLATAEEVPRTGVYIIDGTLLPCWSWKDQPALFSGKHKRTGLNLQVLVGPTGRLLWASDPLPGATHDAKAITASGVLEGLDLACCIGDKGYVGTGITVPYKKPPNGELTKAQKQSNKSLNNIRYVVERTIAHIKSWKILAHDYRRPLDTFKETITATLALYTYTNP